MKLKGEMVIELTDTNTGAVETVQETNMITEAVNNILGLNPMGIYLKASGEYDNSVLWNGTLLPICPNMIGGILLFPAVWKKRRIIFTSRGRTCLRQFSEMGAAFFMGGGFWHEGILELYSDGFYGCRRMAGLVYGRL